MLSAEEDMVDNTWKDCDVEPVIVFTSAMSASYDCIWVTFSMKFSILFFADEKLTNSENVSNE